MKKLILLLFISLVFTCSSDDEPASIEFNNSKSFVFVACEGNFGASNGAIYYISNSGDISSVENVGDVVQSLEVYNDKLFVIINNSHKIIAYDINENGLSLPGIEISTNESSPREMVIINNSLYFTNWNSNDVKKLDLFNYVVSDFTSFDGKPESIIYENEKLFVAIQMNEDYSDSNKIYQIGVESGLIEKQWNVGYGPTSIIKNNNQVYVANTYYDENFNAFYGSSRVNVLNDEVLINNYGDGVVCGGSIHKYDSNIFRSSQGGIISLDNNLNFMLETKIGDEDPLQLYSSEIINNKVYFGITNYTDINLVKIYNANNEIEGVFEVGLFPGDFAYWQEN